MNFNLFKSIGYILLANGVGIKTAYLINIMLGSEVSLLLWVISIVLTTLGAILVSIEVEDKVNLAVNSYTFVFRKRKKKKKRRLRKRKRKCC